MNNIAVRIQTKGTRPRYVRVLRDMLHITNDAFIYGETLWESCARCLTSASSNQSHILVLQDDILPCADLIKTAEKLISLLPNEPITLFTNSEAVNVAMQREQRWVQLTAWFMAQAYILPRQLAEDMVLWIDEYCKDDMVHDDDRMATYMWFHRRKVWATAPSLVEHLGWNETTLTSYKKTYRFEPRLRMATKFLGFEKSGLSVDWTLGINNPIIDNSGINSMFCSNVKKHFEIPLNGI